MQNISNSSSLVRRGLGLAVRSPGMKHTGKVLLGGKKVVKQSQCAIPHLNSHEIGPPQKDYRIVSYTPFLNMADRPQNLRTYLRALLLNPESLAAFPRKLSLKEEKKRY